MNDPGSNSKTKLCYSKVLWTLIHSTAETEGRKCPREDNRICE